VIYIVFDSIYRHRFVDHDMFMCCQGGGVGHKSFQKSITKFCNDHWPDEKKDAGVRQQADITESESEDVPEIMPTQSSKCEVNIELPDNVDGELENTSEPEADLDGVLRSDDELEGTQGSESEAEVDDSEGEPEQAIIEGEIQHEFDDDSDDELEYADF
jgi:hypothetical protein